MGSRRKSRELAMQALFYLDVDSDGWREKLAHFCNCFCPHKKVLPFFLGLVEGVVDVRPQIDCIIENYSSNWKIGRMSGVDRNIMRIAVYELLFRNDIPAKVSINEAIDIGKKYSTEDSGAFINGILDSIREAMDSGQIDLMAQPAEKGSKIRHADEPKTAPKTGPETAGSAEEEKPVVRPSVALSPKVRKRLASRETS